MPRCLPQQCQTTASFNVKLSKRPMYCKEHSSNEMVNVHKKRCFHDCCPTTATFNVTGSKSPVYCKQHAEDGMVNIISKRCAYVLCTKRPSYNMDGMKPPMFCKRHADDGMVNVVRKLCSNHSCTKQPNFNVEGIKPPIFCKTHAEDGMVDVCAKRCLNDSCTTHAKYGLEGTKTSIYCRAHAEDGMVDVRKSRHRNASRGKVQQRLFSSNCVTAPCTAQNPITPDERVIAGLKRSRRQLDRPEPRSCQTRATFTERGVRHYVTIGSSQDAPIAWCAGATPDHAYGTNVQTAAKTNQDSPKSLPLLLKDEPLELTEKIKTELELTLML